MKTGLLSNDESFNFSILHTLQLVSDSCERVKNECVKFIGRATVTECQKICALRQRRVPIEFSARAYFKILYPIKASNKGAFHGLFFACEAQFFHGCFEMLPFPF